GSAPPPRVTTPTTHKAQRGAAGQDQEPLFHFLPPLKKQTGILVTMTYILRYILSSFKPSDKIQV
ncbi:MAG: hypothetical protein KGZ70_09785, partial [Hydrogenophaga sp.]|nr:hypothetical protein [Hydrogenophaga sp.]